MSQRPDPGLIVSPSSWPSRVGGAARATRGKPLTAPAGGEPNRYGSVRKNIFQNQIGGWQLTLALVQTWGAGHAHPDPVASPMGDFTVEMTVEEGASPDQTLFEKCRALVDQFVQDVDKITELLHESYRDVAEEDPDWFEEAEIPTDLRPDQLADLLETRSLTISSEPNHRGEEYPARVYISPEWDEEHGFYLKFAGSSWEQVEC